MSRLIVIKGPGTGKTVEFTGETTLGRGEENKIVIDDPSVSQRHAVLRPAADGVILADRGSRNGTWCSGGRISEILLHDGGEFSIGRLTFRLALASEEVTGGALPRRPTLLNRKTDRGSKAAWALALLLLPGIPATVYLVLNWDAAVPRQTG
ncbi:MAG: FHA domain-containing protein, partial [Akkermansiaceae bacterium]|nr:FHA domain-containing protein [Akkermansiaceae bacterium]